MKGWEALPNFLNYFPQPLSSVMREEKASAIIYCNYLHALVRSKEISTTSAQIFDKLSSSINCFTSQKLHTI